MGKNLQKAAMIKMRFRANITSILTAAYRELEESVLGKCGAVTGISFSCVIHNISFGIL